MSLAFHASWTRDARSVLARAIGRHGGLDAWQSAEVFDIYPTAMWGVVPFIKGYRRAAQLPSRYEIHPQERRTVLHDFPRAGLFGVFSRGDVAIFDARDPSRPIEACTAARRRFSGWAKYRLWQPLDWLYFLGYASTGYYSAPFAFPSFRFIESFTMREGGEVFDALVLEFPEAFDAHCRVQTFYFDGTGLLRRNDYHAEIIGRWAMAAHYSTDYREMHGVQVALCRHVCARLGRYGLPLVAIHAPFQLEQATPALTPSIARSALERPAAGHSVGSPP